MQPTHENSESHDGDSQERSCTNTNPLPVSTITANTTSNGFYNAEKCRAFIANQIRVSKIDRFAVQIGKAIEIEASVQSRLRNILTMFVRTSAKVTHDFTFRCKLGLQRHRQDRILNQRRKSSFKNKADVRLTDNKRYSISNDLLYGSGAQLVHTLLIQSLPQSRDQQKQSIVTNHQLRHDSPSHANPKKSDRPGTITEDDYLLSDSFDPALYVGKLKDCIRVNLQKSRAITRDLNTIRQLFERLASEHRDQVDLVYTAEEERQTNTVIRRSAYNLSMAAIKATSTPIHVNVNSNITEFS